MKNRAPWNGARILGGGKEGSCEVKEAGKSKFLDPNKK